MGDRQAAVLEAEPAHQDAGLHGRLDILGDLVALDGGQRLRGMLAQGAVAGIRDDHAGPQRPGAEGRLAAPGPAAVGLELLRERIADAPAQEFRRRVRDELRVDDDRMRRADHAAVATIVWLSS